MNVLKLTVNLLVAILIIVVFGTAVQAQSGHFSAASLGMGGTGTAFLDTYHANFVNPANMMLNSDSKPSTTVGILGGLSATAGGPLANISVYNDYFTTGDVVGGSALNAWFGTNPSASRRMGVEVDAIPIGLSWRGEKMGLSLALRNRSIATASMNRGYAEVMLLGVNRDRFGTSKPVDFSSRGISFSEVSAAVSIPLLELPSLPGLGKNVKVYAGIAPKYIIPHQTSSMDFNSTLEVTENEVIHDFEYTFQTVGNLTGQFEDYYQASRADDFNGSLGDFVKPDANTFTEVQGGGFGVDLGGTVEMDLAGPLEQFFSFAEGPKKLRVGVAISDLGTVTYNNNAGSFTADKTFTWEGIEFEDGFDQALADSISREIYLNYQPGTKGAIKQNLPTKLSMGAHLRLGKLGFALDLQKGFNEVGMNSRRIALGVGAEYKLFSIIPLRAGYRTGGLTSSSISFGTGLELQNFEFTIGGLTVPNSRNRGSGVGAAWSGLIFRF